jgi:hypothetical protein
MITKKLYSEPRVDYDLRQKEKDMGKQDLPHYKKKQQLLHAKSAKPEELRRQGEEFLQAGWLSDAIDFFSQAGDRNGMEKIRDIAVEEGDTFLFRCTLKAMDAVAEEAEWERLADRAFELKKLQFAREAYRMSGDRKSLDKVDRLINPEPEEEPE